MTEFDRAAAYRGARERMSELVRAAGGAACADTPVPATPKWTVHDLVAHVRGVVGDALSGNMAGAPGEEWTAAQVARAGNTGVDLLLEEWSDDSVTIEQVLETAPAGRLDALVMDVHADEQDLRGALQMPGERSGPFYEWCVPNLVAAFRARSQAAGLAPARIVFDDGSAGGEEGDPVTLTTSQWEFFRAAMGRRSVAQVAALAWTGTDEPAAYAEPMMIFGPAAADVPE